MKDKVDVLGTSSDRKGVMGHLETLLRKFRDPIFAALMLPLLFLYVFCLGVSLAPAVGVVYATNAVATGWPFVLYCLAMGCAIATGFFCFGFTLIFVVPFVNWACRIKVKPWRGSGYSLEAVPWYYHNALTYLVRYTFLEFITPTPLNVLFYKMMGMKIGRGVSIATTNISDPCLITLEDHVSIGGSATIIGHYATKGFLVLAPVVIKKGAMIGLKASVMGDVVVGEKALVKAHTVLMPKTRVAKGATA